MNRFTDSTFTRRAFLGRGMTLASAAVTTPWFLHASARVIAAQPGAIGSRAGVPDDRILVVVQLAGGNDGLNTIVPFNMDAYYRARPRIAVPKREVITLDRKLDMGLHPSLDGLKRLYDDGLLSIVQGVGYPNPNRSHFKSMDIWHTADHDATGDGWIGKYFDNECAGQPDGCDPDAGIALGAEAPLAMQGREFNAVSFETPEMFAWNAKGMADGIDDAYHDIVDRGAHPDVDEDSNAAFLMRTAMDARVSSARIRAAVEDAKRDLYPRGGNLGEQLAMVAAMIRSGLQTRVYYVTLGGFDTHAGQGGPQGRHANLLAQLGGSLSAFYKDLAQSDADQRVLTMCFSEFGRRVAQNGSNGTDHGAAAPMFLAGPMVRAGVLGRHPSLTDLDNGDLKFNVDFRSVYTGILEDWMGADARAVLGKRYKEAKVIRA